MKTYRESRGIAPHFLNLGTRWMWMVKFTSQPLYLQESTLVSIEYEVVWSPESVRKICRRENYFAPTGIWTMDFPTRYVVAVAGPFFNEVSN